MKRIITNFFNLKESLIYYEYRYLKLKKKFKFFDNLNLNQNSIVLDLGSNVGDVTKYIYKKYNSFIYGYEPNIHAYNLQKKRFNNIEKIKIYNECIDIEDGERKIYFHKNSKDKGDIEHSHASSLDIDKANISPDNFQIAKSRSIKSILDKFNKIDLIKIDIEGNEYKILPEIMKNKNKIQKVLCELHGRPNNKNKDQIYTKSYLNLISKLKNEKLLNDWFIEWH